jgi:hypothetical protein
VDKAIFFSISAVKSNQFENGEVKFTFLIVSIYVGFGFAINYDGKLRPDQSNNLLLFSLSLSRFSEISYYLYEMAPSAGKSPPGTHHGLPNSDTLSNGWSQNGNVKVCNQHS